MMTQMNIYKVYTTALLLLALLLGQLLSVTTVQASSHAGQQRVANCHTTVLAGWRPYRVQAGDSLAALAAQAQVSVAELMQVNCLTVEEISADSLLLAPVPGNAKRSGVLAAPVLAAPPAVASTAQLTIISTTTTMAANSATATSAATPTSRSSLPSLPWPWLTLVAFGLVGLATVFVSFRPAQPGATPTRGRFGLWSNLLFLGMGIFIGVVIFPEWRMPSLRALPTGVSTTVTVALIGLLVAKELFFQGPQWRATNRVLNVGLVPLLMLFFLTVATRVAETIN